MPSDDLTAARELFSGYDGSRSAMLRDGVEEQYLRYGVPDAVEAAWLDELLQQRLAGLDQPGNWRSVAFLAAHRRAEYLDRVAAAEPLGEWWERCAFLEDMLRYVEYTCRVAHPSERLAELCRSIAVRAEPLAETIPADQPPDRVARLIAEAARVETSMQPSP